MLNLFKYLFIISAALFIACSSFNIKNFPNTTSPENDAYLAGNFNYHRNTIGLEELDPPLQIAWRQDYFALPVNGFTSTRDWFIFGAGTGHIAAAKMEDGELVGKKKLGRACSSPPTIFGNLLFVTYEAGSYGLVAFDVFSGDEIWSIENYLTYSSPIVVDKKVIYQSKNGIVFCFNYLTGDQIWKTDLKTNTHNSLAFDENILISAGLEGKITAVEYTSGLIIWQKELNMPIIADPVISDGKIFLASRSGNIIVLNKKSGTQINQIKLNIPMYFGPTIDSDFIYIGLSEGSLYALNKTTLAEVWIFNGDGPVSASPLVTDKYVYYTTLAKQFYILDKASGELLQNIKLEGRARSTPLISNKKLIIANEEKMVVAYVEKK